MMRAIRNDIGGKTVSILLTKENRIFSKGIYWLTGRKYTHASIRLDDMGDTFFSFTFRGFSEEPPRRFRPQRVVRSVLYQMEVPEEAYEEIKFRLNGFLKYRQYYRYSLLGMLLCLLRIPHKSPGAYFCSQFVADLLARSGVIRLGRDASVCLPNTLERAIQQGAVPYRAIADPVFA